MWRPVHSRIPQSLLVAALTLSGGCRHAAAPPPSESTAQPASTEGAVALAAQVADGRSAFVVITRDNTWVLPTNPELPIARWPGMFVGDPGNPNLAHGRIDMGVGVAVDFVTERELPWCADATLDAACLRDLDDTRGETAQVRVVRRDDGQVEAAVALPCDCVAVRGISTDEVRPPEFDLTDPETLEMIKMSGHAPEEYAEYCGVDAFVDPFAPTAVLDGVLYRTGTTHNNMCSGLNLYDGGSDVVLLRPGAKPLERNPGPPMECVPDSAGMGNGLDLALLVPGQPMECEFGGDGCENCDVVGEMTAFANRRGHLVFGAADVDAVGVGCSCAQHQPLPSVECPGVLEPCGDPAGFEGATASANFWVATDHSGALAIDESGTRMFGTNETVPRRTSASIGGVLGVEFHPDSPLLRAVSPRSLPALIGASLPPLLLGDAKKKLGARGWWLRCNEHLDAGRLDAAEAACIAGLRKGGNRLERAHLVLALSRIETKRGNAARAQQFLQRWNRLERSSNSMEIGGGI